MARERWGYHQISNFVDVLIRTLFQIFAVFLGFGVAGLTGGFVWGTNCRGVDEFPILLILN